MNLFILNFFSAFLHLFIVLSYSFKQVGASAFCSTAEQIVICIFSYFLNWQIFICTLFLSAVVEDDVEWSSEAAHTLPIVHIVHIGHTVIWVGWVELWLNTA